jgi:hypothetical protein
MMENVKVNVNERDGVSEVEVGRQERVERVEREREREGGRG